MNIYAVSTIIKELNNVNITTFLLVAQSKGSAVDIIMNHINKNNSNISFQFVEKELGAFLSEHNINTTVNPKVEQIIEKIDINKMPELDENILLVKKDKVSEKAYNQIKKILDNEIKNNFIKL